MNAPADRSILGTPLYRITGDEMRIVEGRLGNPIYLNDDQLFNERGEPSGTFFVLVAARAGQTPQQVAEQFAAKQRLWIRPFSPGPEGREPGVVELEAVPDGSIHLMDETARETPRYRPSLGHLSPLYGDDADFYQIAFHLTRGRELVFGTTYRTEHSVNFRKFDLVQSSVDGMVEAIHRGGLAIFDRQKPDRGTPDFYRMAVTGDWHASRRNDEFEKRAIELARRTGDPTLYLKINNPNANLDEALRPFLNQRTLAGEGPDSVFTLGDDKDYDGNRHEVAARLADSNDYLVGRILAGFVAPVFTTPGNHSTNGEEYPATLIQENFDLTEAEIRTIQSDRHRGPQLPLLGPAIGFTRRTIDGAQSAIPDENALIPTYDLINPFPDSVLNLGRGDPANPRSKEVLLFRLNMGEADLFHWKQNDPIYRSNQGWPLQSPYFHPTTVAEAIGHKTPDLKGPSSEQLDWFRQLINQRDVYGILMMHPPLLNSLRQQQHHDPQGPLVPFTPAGDHEDLTHNTMTHGEELVEAVARSPHLKAVITGHTHRFGNFYGLGIDPKDRVRILRGTGLNVLEGMNETDAISSRYFWHPGEGCEGKCDPAIDTLFNGAVGGLRRYKATWQAGAAGVTPAPVFTIYTIHPEGLISHAEIFYVNKVLEQDAENPDRYRVRRVVSHEPLAGSRLVDEWKSIRSKNPKAWIDFSGALAAIERRLDRTDTSILPHPQSLNDYARYNPIIRNPYIAPTKLHSHLRLRTGGTTHGHGHGAIMLSAEYVFSQNQLGNLPRAFLLEGVELYWFRMAGGRHHFSPGVRLPTVLDWKLSDHLLWRGPGLGLGAGFSIGESSADAAFYFHNHLNLFELNYHTPRWELFLGVDRHEFFRDLANFPSFLADRSLAEGGHFWGIAGAALTFE